MTGLTNIFVADAALSDVCDAVARDGYAIVQDAISADARDALIADLEPTLEAAHTGHDSFMGHKTKRFGALLARSSAVQQRLMHPYVLGVADNALLPHCVRYHVHYTGVMHLEPGENKQVLHRDTSMFPIANPCPPLTLATMWAMTDFTADNGGTRIVPGSHLWDNDRVPQSNEIHSAEMPAGSVLIYTGNVIHGGGANRSNASRTGVALHYALGWLRQEENQYLAVPHEQARELPREVQALMGYALGSPNLGFVDHVDPQDYLNGVRDAGESALTSTDLNDRPNALQRMHVSQSAPGRARYYHDVEEDC